MSRTEYQESFDLARKQLERVQVAWNEPTDWFDLAMYGFYCLENGVMAAALKIGWTVQRSHPGKVEAAKKLAKEGLPDVSTWLVTLNAARKAFAYGDMAIPAMDAEDTAVAIEEFMVAVGELVGEEPW